MKHGRCPRPPKLQTRQNPSKDKDKCPKSYPAKKVCLIHSCVERKNSFIQWDDTGLGMLPQSTTKPCYNKSWTNAQTLLKSLCWNSTPFSVTILTNSVTHYDTHPDSWDKAVSRDKHILFWKNDSKREKLQLTCSPRSCIKLPKSPI